MSRLPSVRLLAFASLAASLAVAGDASAKSGRHHHPSRHARTLASFDSEADFRAFLKRVQKANRTRATAAKGDSVGAVPPPPAPSPAPEAAASDAAAAPASAEAPSQPSITNTQEANVDEGGIVKMHGDTLVILRRGRLFTVSTRNGDLKPIDSINAFPPGVDPSSDWYDEMLVSGDRVIVIGYSYGRGGTEINRFRIGGDGKLAFDDAYHIRSNDYYSSRNYASRLIGSHLIVYSPLYLPYNAADSEAWLPAVRRWDNSSDHGIFKRTVVATDIYHPNLDPSQLTEISALHTVTNCDLAAATLHCSAKAVLGPSGRTFYVSSKAVYVWVSSYRRYNRDEKAFTSSLYRLPLDGSAPSAIGVRGAPTDQFSFREDANEGKLNVLVRSEGGGDAMWNPEFSSGAMALLQLSLDELGDGDTEARKRDYRDLPEPKGDGYNFQNRFVGDYVLYGNGSGWGSQGASKAEIVVASLRRDDVTRIPLNHGVDRIDALGRDAVVVGSDGKDLQFRSVELTDGSSPHIGDRYVLPNASQGETRSQAFFFKPEPAADGRDASAGVLGLPVTRAGRPGYGQLEETSAAVLFIRRQARQFSPLGDLSGHDRGEVDDGCKASCVDWYGNSRPIFLGNRTFALMGYEIVEGTLSDRAITEKQRISFAPGRGD